MIFSHILLAYDGSAAAEKALQTAVEMAKQSEKIKLTVVHVVNLPVFILGESLIPAPASMEVKWMEQAEKNLEEVKQKIEHLPNKEANLLTGNPAVAILEYAEKNQCDLIVVGNRGLGSLREFMLGSVSHNVVQHADIPVLIVK